MRPIFRSAARGNSHAAAKPGGGRLGLLLLGLGAMAIIAGVALLVTSLAPLVEPRSDSAIVIAPSGAPVDVDSGPSTASLPDTSTPGPKPALVAARQEGPIDGYSFELRIPAIGYSAMVHQGVTVGALSRGPGHYPTTPWPGSLGNVGVAAHNTYWLSFNRLKVGDQVQIVTQHALYVYQITGSRVVSPTDRTVLVPTNTDMLTMTTCYPLWAGALATQRLVFTARALGGVA